MPSETAMKATMQAYFDDFNAGNLDGMASHFADNAVIEDPVGTPAHSGTAAIRAYLEGVVKNAVTLSLSSPIRGSHGNATAVALEAKVGSSTIIRAIDVMTFDDAGKIESLKAYFGSEDVTQS